MRRRKNKQRGPVRAKKVIYDGITFASGLEKYMHRALKKANIKNKYEGETFTLIEGFKKYGTTLHEERTTKMKGLMKYLVDIQEELMDAILYIQTAQEELKDVLNETSKE